VFKLTRPFVLLSFLLIPTCVFSMSEATVKRRAVRGKVSLLQPLVTAAEEAGQEQSKTGKACRSFAWYGHDFPGYPFARIALHDSCFVTVYFKQQAIDKKLQGLRLVYQPKAYSGAIWKPGLKGKAGILSYICTIVPGQNTTHAMKPRIQALFAKLPGSLNSCVFSSDTL